MLKLGKKMWMEALFTDCWSNELSDYLTKIQIQDAQSWNHAPVCLAHTGCAQGYGSL